MGRAGELFEEIQKRLDDIETEATRLIVFANSTSDAALGSQLKKTAKVIFQSATEIEDRRKTTLEATTGKREEAK
jgi:hypothetical protein